MSSRQPRAVQTPYEGTESSSVSYGSVSRDPNDPNVQRYSAAADRVGNAEIDIDPGLERRYDLAEQSQDLNWESAFAGGIPEALRRQQVDVGRRALRSEQAAARAQAEYLQNELRRTRDLQYAGLVGNLLPQIMQTGATGYRQGYGSQVATPQPGILSDIIGGASRVAGAYAGAR